MSSTTTAGSIRCRGGVPTNRGLLGPGGGAEPRHQPPDRRSGRVSGAYDPPARWRLSERDSATRSALNGRRVRAARHRGRGLGKPCRDVSEGPVPGSAGACTPRTRTAVTAIRLRAPKEQLNGKAGRCRYGGRSQPAGAAGTERRRRQSGWRRRLTPSARVNEAEAKDHLNVTSGSWCRRTSPTCAAVRGGCPGGGARRCGAVRRGSGWTTTPVSADPLPQRDLMGPGRAFYAQGGRCASTGIPSPRTPWQTPPMLTCRLPGDRDTGWPRGVRTGANTR